MKRATLHLCLKALLGIVPFFPVSALSECIPGSTNSAGTVHFQCSNGAEFKIDLATGSQRPAAKLRILGAFETSDYTGAFIEKDGIVKLDAKYKVDSSTGPAKTFVAQTVYAFMRGDNVVWVSVSHQSENGKNISIVTHNLAGPIKTETIKGDFDLPLPKQATVAYDSVTLLSPDQVYQRFGL